MIVYQVIRKRSSEGEGNKCEQEKGREKEERVREKEGRLGGRIRNVKSRRGRELHTIGQLRPHLFFLTINKKKYLIINNIKLYNVYMHIFYYQ